MPKKPLNHRRVSVEQVTESLRPIGARALKSAIDTLRPHLSQAKVLDLYAGQGRFGVTASLEGISSVSFVESNHQTARELKALLSSKSFPKGISAQVYVEDVFNFLKRQTPKSFDLIFADPPFPLWTGTFESELLTLVSSALKSGSIFLVKHPKRMLPCSEIAGLKLFKSSDFGESRLQYFEYDESN